MRSSITDGTPGLSSIQDRTGHVVDELFSGVKEQAKELKEEYVDAGLNRAVAFVKANPGKTVLITAALGILAGSLLLRRR